MIRRHRQIRLLLLMVALIGASHETAASQEAQSVKLGEAALRFAGGSIRQTVPQDGIVNFLTGDNQTTGNRMILGWRGTDVLYIKLHRPDEPALGDLYTVYRRTRKVFHPRTKHYMGYIVNRLAVVRVTQIDHDLATVQIVQSYAPLSPGDSVMRFVPPVLDETAADPQISNDDEGMVVDLQADKNMSLVGQGNLVYLDRGRGHGVRPGDRFEVDRTGGGLPRRKIAEIKILSTEDETATAVITRSTSRVLVGDRVRYRDSSAVDELRSWQRPSQGQDASAVVAGAETLAPAVASSAKLEPKLRMVPVEGGTRIDLDELVEQLEYESGEVKVKAAGLPILDRIADFLKTAASDKPVRVEGHADNMEIGPSLKSSFASNWDLSRARAAGIMRHLVEKGGLDSAKLTAVGYGSTRPVASNATEEGRKRNRRIEIVLYTTGASESIKEIGEASVSMPVKPFIATVEPAKIFVPVPAGGVAENQSGQAELVQPIGDDKSDGHPVMTPVQ
ncbi:OmpA family protein [Nitrospira sp. Nam80]